MSKLWLLLFALTPLLKGEVKQQIILPNDYEVIEDNTIIANSPIPLYAKVYSAMSENIIEQPIIEPIIEPIKEDIEIENQEYISCLINCESGGNENAIGDNGKANGILQYHFPTWQSFCVRQYGFLESQYKDSQSQVECCSRMLEDGLKNHWTCSKVCDKM